MSDLLDKLLGDHERQHRLLERLRSLGTAHPTASGRAVMLNIMQYMRRYPDLNHHPIEDRLFARIGARDGSLAAAAVCAYGGATETSSRQCRMRARMNATCPAPAFRTT